MYLNKATLIGNLTRDPELKSLPSGASVTNFSIATNRTWKDRDGEKKEDVEYHNIVVFGRMAETCAKYLKKGHSVLVEGRIATRSWEKDGAKHYKTEIVAEGVQFGPKKDGASSAASTQAIKVHYPDDEINPDDITF